MVLLPIRPLHRDAMDLDVCILVPKSLTAPQRERALGAKVTKSVMSKPEVV